MGQYGEMFYLGPEAHGDIPDSVLVCMVRDSAIGAGYHPTTGAGEVNWHEVTTGEEERMQWFGETGLRAGDWRVRVMVPVEEEDEIPSAQSPE